MSMLSIRRSASVSQPEISVGKFVPFSTLEFTATVEVVGDIALPDYKKIKLAPKKVTVTATDVDDVLNNLALRRAEKVQLTRAAKNGDELVIDFVGVDTKSKEPIDEPTARTIHYSRK